jgi:AraC-like DNA-binding protein
MKSNWDTESTDRTEQNRNSPIRQHRAGSTDTSPTELALEKHYSVLELSQLWGLSEKTIRRMFSDEPGVVRFGHEERRFKRGYVTLRIPESVVQRVHRRLRYA